MADFLQSIENSKANPENQDGKERVEEAGISSAALKKQLKRLTKGNPNLYNL